MSPQERADRLVNAKLEADTYGPPMAWEEFARQIAQNIEGAVSSETARIAGILMDYSASDGTTIAVAGVIQELVEQFAPGFGFDYLTN